MEEKIKGIISVFIKIPAEQIVPATAIGRSALQSSILLHRMYARLAEEGLIIENYGNIKVFADLWPSSNTVGDPVTRSASDPATASPAAALASPAALFSAVGSAGTFNPGIGLDIEEIAALPVTNDFRRDEFYKMNFTATEIAYCILQPDPYSSFAGLFAVKEAIIKADGQYRNRPFNTIEIDHSPEGKPLFPGFGISISHAAGLAVAVAARSATDLFALSSSGQPVISGHNGSWSSAQNASANPGPPARSSVASWVAWIALILSVMALLLVFIH